MPETHSAHCKCLSCLVAKGKAVLKHHDTPPPPEVQGVPFAVNLTLPQPVINYALITLHPDGSFLVTSPLIQSREWTKATLLVLEGAKVLASRAVEAGQPVPPSEQRIVRP